MEMKICIEKLNYQENERNPFLVLFLKLILIFIVLENEFHPCSAIIHYIEKCYCTLKHFSI